VQEVNERVRRAAVFPGHPYQYPPGFVGQRLAEVPPPEVNSFFATHLVPSQAVLFVIGDSISIQYGPFLASMVAGLWSYARKSNEEEALLDLDQPQGANGGDSARVLTYLQALEKRGTWRPDLLLLNCGLHDLKTDKETGAKQVPLAAYEANLEAAAACLTRMGVRTAWVRTTPVHDEWHAERKPFFRYLEDVRAYNTVADRVMKAAGNELLDLFTFTLSLDHPQELSPDGVHFTESTQRLQAAFIAGYLSAALGS